MLKHQPQLNSNDLLITLRGYIDNPFTGFSACFDALTSLKQQADFIKNAISLIDIGKLDSVDNQSLMIESFSFFKDTLKSCVINPTTTIFRKYPSIPPDTLSIIHFFTKLELFRHIVITVAKHDALYQLIKKDNMINSDWFITTHHRLVDHFERLKKIYSLTTDNQLSINISLSKLSKLTYRLKADNKAQHLSIFLILPGMVFILYRLSTQRLSATCDSEKQASKLFISAIVLFATTLMLWAMFKRHQNNNKLMMIKRYQERYQTGNIEKAVIFSNNIIKKFFFSTKDNLEKVTINYNDRINGQDNKIICSI
jgi:hypothetical protein